jgi:hypothetical protein
MGVEPTEATARAPPTILKTAEPTGAHPPPNRGVYDTAA